MRTLILLHSVTGNTRLMTRYAASCIAAAGHPCAVHDIVAKPKPPALGGVDLLGLACPTMYFRPTFAMEGFVARLPAAKKPKPAFLLATAGGEPGAHFFLLAEQLAHKGYLVLGAHWVIFPESWPPHRALARRLEKGAPYGDRLCRRYPSLRPLLGMAWPEISAPQAGDRESLRRFLGDLLEKASGFDSGRAPAIRDLHRPMPGFGLMGRLVTRDMAAQATAPRLEAARCSRCGLCVKVCPAGCITRADDNALPVFGPGCSGCWACFQHCPEQAIAGWKVGPGEGRYAGPAPGLREMFAPVSSSGTPKGAVKKESCHSMLTPHKHGM